MKFKRLLAFFLSLLVVITIAPTFSAYETPDNISEDGFTYYGDSTFLGITVTGYVGPEVEHLVIPDYIIGASVTILDISAFSRMTNVKTITLPKNLKVIGADAFNGCTSVETIEIPKSVSEIHDSAFKNCTSLKNVVFCDDNVRISSAVFKGCSSLESIDLPKGLASINGSLLEDCTSLKRVGIPDSVETIGGYAFSGCSSLESIELPKRTRDIDKGAFRYCTSLKSIEYPEGLKSVAMHTFADCTSLESFTFHADTLLDPALVDYYPTGTKFVIDHHAFSGCSALKDVYCYGTEADWNSIYWPNQQEEDGHEYFNKAKRTFLTPNIPEGLNYTVDRDAKETVITDYDGTSKEVTLPSTIEGYPVTTIESTTFSYNEYLEKLSLPESITEIGGGAFYSCPKLESVTFPRNITKINNQTFYHCTSLKSIVIPDWVDTIGEEAFSGCTALSSVTIPNSVTTIEDNAFTNCSALKSIDLPSKLKSIEPLTFMNCKGLESIVIPESVSKINTSAFRNCQALKSITLPAGLSSVEQGAFYGCSALTDVYFTGFAENWDGIYIGINNDPLKSASLHAHNHSWQYLKTTREATCSREGEKLYSCSCGGQKAEAISKLAHKEVKDNAVAPSCDETGLTEGSHCSVCNEVIVAQQTVEKLPHTYDNDCDAICNVCYELRQTEGHKYDNACDDTCNKCQAKRDIEGHKYDNACDDTCNSCNATREVEGHKYDNACDADCNNCQAQREVAGHQYKWEIDKAAGCKATGLKHEECEICHSTRNENTSIPATGEHYYDNDCDESCNGCLAARTVTHDYDWVIDEPATCANSGKKHQECKICHKKKGILSTTIPATGKHTYEYSCSSACKVCGKTRVAFHSYEWIIDKPNTCSASGVKHQECKICHSKTKENTIIAATNKHSLKVTTVKATLSKDGYTVNKCSACEKEIGRKTAIKYVKSSSLSTSAYTYSGKENKPTVTVKDSAGKKLVRGTDYTVSYKNNKNPGKASVTILLKGKYSGTKTLTFTINPKGTTVLKLTAAKKSLKVSIKKQTSGTTGYEIQYSTSKKFTKANTKTATVKSSKTTSATLKSLKAKKTYYVRIRTYKTVSGKKYYSAWSGYKSKKTK